MKRYCPIIITVLLAVPTVASGQLTNSDFEREELRLTVQSDTMLFYRLRGPKESLYVRQTDYVGTLHFRSRMMPDNFCDHRLDGIDLTTLTSPYGNDRTLEQLLRTMPSGGERNGWGDTDRTLAIASLNTSNRLRAAYGDTRNRLSLSWLMVDKGEHKWNCALSTQLRTGSDRLIEGVYGSTASLTATVERMVNRGRLGITAATLYTLYSSRSSSTAEAFALTGNNLYNPAWGVWNGSKRSSRLNENFVPALFVRYNHWFAATELTLSAGVWGGNRRRSSLGWFGAANPSPDYYNRMPSYYNDPQVRELTSAAWEANNLKYTQIDWTELVAQNAMSASGTRYMLYNDLTKPLYSRLACNISHTIDSRTTIVGGVRLALNREHRQRELSDLLGGRPFADIDQYLVDDENYGDKIFNNSAQSDKLIDRGEKFAYHYLLYSLEAEVFAAVNYRSGAVEIDLTACLGERATGRKGFFEKESLPGSASLGSSKQLLFSTFSIKAHLSLLMGRNTLVANINCKSLPVATEDMFLNCQYSNTTVLHPALQKLFAGEIGWRHNADYLTFDAALFGWFNKGATQTERLYDDLSATFCDMVVSNIDTGAAGIEVGAESRLSDRLTLSLVGSATMGGYLSNPSVSLYSDTDHSIVVKGSSSAMRGLSADSSPRYTAIGTLRYYNPRGWYAALTVSGFADRPIAPSVLRRTERVVATASSAQQRELLTVQQRLGNGCDVQIMAGGRVKIGSHKAGINAGVRNLLNNKEMKYSGYESSRIRRQSSGATTLYTPFANRYLCAYPRTFWASITFDF